MTQDQGDLTITTTQRVSNFHLCKTLIRRLLSLVTCVDATYSRGQVAGAALGCPRGRPRRLEVVGGALALGGRRRRGQLIKLQPDHAHVRAGLGERPGAGAGSAVRSCVSRIPESIMFPIYILYFNQVYLKYVQL